MPLTTPTFMVSDLKVPQYGVPDQSGGPQYDGPVATNTTIYGGAIVVSDAAGNYTHAQGSGPTMVCWGVANRQAVNTTAVTGGQAQLIPFFQVNPGTWAFINGISTDAIAQANIGQAAYAIDDRTVGLSSATNTRTRVGTIVGLSPEGLVYVKIEQKTTV